VIGQHARNVFQQAAAGDVRQRLDAARWRIEGVLRQRLQHAAHVNARGRHDGLAQRLAVEGGGQVGCLALEALAQQRKAIRVHATGGQAQHHVAAGHGLPSEDARFFHRPDAKTGQIVLARRVHARHFGGLAADQGAARQFAAARDAAHHRRRGIDIQLAAGKVVEEKQRLGALHQHVVDAHGHQVDAHRVVQLPLEGQLELGAHAVGA